MEAAPSIEFAKRITDAFGVSLDYLAGEGTLSKLDKKTVKRLQEIERLKEDDKNHFFSIVDAFLRDATARKAYASLTTRAASLRLLLLIAIFFPFLFYSRY